MEVRLSLPVLLSRLAAVSADGHEEPSLSLLANSKVGTVQDAGVQDIVRPQCFVEFLHGFDKLLERDGPNVL